MNVGYYIRFNEKHEQLDLGNGPTEYSLGHLLFSFLDVNWAELSKAAPSACIPDLDFKDTPYYRAICAQCGPCLAELLLTPILGEIMLDHSSTEVPLTPDLIQTLEQRFSLLSRFRMELVQAVSQVLDVEGPHADLTPVQRYYLFQHTNSAFQAMSLELYGQVTVQNRISGTGALEFAFSRHRPIEEIERRIAEAPLQCATFFCSQDVRALVLLEFDYLCAQGIALRQCTHCGRYFIPFSSRSRYCDRLVAGTDKSCKEYAALQIYRQKVNADEAKKLFLKRSNAYRMRVRRNPERYTSESYQIWLARASRLLSQFENGEIEFDDFSKRISP